MKNRGRVIGTNPFGRASTPGSDRDFADAATGRTAVLESLMAETDRPVPRPVAYVCPAGHHVVVSLFLTATIPRTWECTVHRQVATLTGAESLTGAGAIIAELVDTRARHTPKTHWKHVQARRTTHELEALLAERLEYLHSRRAA
jgi:hypothetical protein